MNRTRYELIALLCTSLCISGCAGGIIGGGKKAMLYRIGHEPPPATSGETPGDVAVVIMRPEFPAGTDGERILTLSGRAAAYLADARWVTPAPDLMREALVGAFGRAAPSVYVPNGRTARADFVLTTRFTMFAAYYEAGAEAPPVVRLVAQSELRRAGDSEPVAVHIHATEQRATENRVTAVVDAFDAATTQLTDQIARWTEVEIGARKPVAEARARGALPRFATEHSTSTSS